MQNRFAHLPVLVIALVSIVLHLYCAGNMEYHRDELLYFALGRHLDLGYRSIPPLTAWIAAAVQYIIGTSVLAVKLVPALLNGVYVLLAAGLARELGGGRYSQLLAAITVLLMPVTLRTFYLFQPVHLDLLAWTAVFYYSLRYINTRASRYLLLLGVVIGLGLLTKYLIVLLILCMLTALLLSHHREVFRERQLYVGMGVALLIFLPNLYWQWAHDWPVFGHLAELNETQLTNVSRGAFLADQLLMCMAGAFLLLWGIIDLLRRPKYRYVAVTGILVICVLCLLRGKSYYTIGTFMPLIAGGAVACERWLTYNDNNWRKAVRYILPIGMVLFTLPILPFGVPIYDTTGMIDYYQMLETEYGTDMGRRDEQGNIQSLPQDYADALGWRELAQNVRTIYKQLPPDAEVMIYAENYGQAGAVDLVNLGQGLPEVVSFSDTYAYWVPRSFEREITHFIYINDELGEDVNALFAEVQTYPGITHPDARESGTTIYLCTQPQRPFSQFWAEVLERVFGE